jgi:two-component system, OmpR family, phosphate regulon sensor histidine kinase PhoR
MNMLLAAFAAAVVTAVLLWPTLRMERRRRKHVDDRLAETRRALAIKRAESVQYRGLFDALLDAYPLPVLVTTRERTIVVANRAALRLIHLPQQRVVGRVLATVVQDYETTQTLLEAAESNTQRERTFQRVISGETWRVIATPLHVHGQAPDHAGSESADSASHLILTIENLTELRRLEKVRADFVAHVSHELRTPLAAMKLLAETLEVALDKDPPAARTFARRISAEIQHLSQMVAELLELSRIESGKIQLRCEPVELAGLIEVVVARMCPLAVERGVTLLAETPEGLPDALADGERIADVLVNLIHNAIKYTPSGGSVAVGAEVVPASSHATPAADAPGDELSSDETMLAVYVRDTGIGISAEDLPRIFERFYKVDRARTRMSRDTEEGTVNVEAAQENAAAGTGLGLAIARHLVELHGGQIKATSRLGLGSTFTFTLPMATSTLEESLSVPGVVGSGGTH